MHDGWEVEPDQRHVDLIVQEMCMTDGKLVSTPGESATKEVEMGRARREDERRSLDSEGNALDTRKGQKEGGAAAPQMDGRHRRLLQNQAWM